MAILYYFNEQGDKVSVTGKELKELAKAGTIVPDTIIETVDGKQAPARRVKGLTFRAMAQSKMPQVSPVTKNDEVEKFFDNGYDDTDCFLDVFFEEINNSNVETVQHNPYHKHYLNVPVPSTQASLYDTVLEWLKGGGGGALVIGSIFVIPVLVLSIVFGMEHKSDVERRRIDAEQRRIVAEQEAIAKAAWERSPEGKAAAAREAAERARQKREQERAAARAAQEQQAQAAREREAAAAKAEREWIAKTVVVDEICSCGGTGRYGECRFCYKLVGPLGSAQFASTGCTICQGTGKNLCTTCNGRGTVPVRRLPNP